MILLPQITDNFMMPLRRVLFRCLDVGHETHIIAVISLDTQSVYQQDFV